jgi:hypothetical protein
LLREPEDHDAPQLQGFALCEDPYPHMDRSPLGPILSWAFPPLRSVPPAPRDRLPDLFPHALSPFLTPKRKKQPVLQGLDEHRSSSSREGRPTPLRFSPGNCPRFLPTTAMPARANPSSEASTWVEDCSSVEV